MADYRVAARWQNWGRSESVVPVERVRPVSADEVASIVRAARDRGMRVKPVGTSHSFSGIAVAPGIQLDMSALTGVVRSTGNHVTLGSGTVLHALPPLLGPLGLALQNMGDIDVQTISGATSTGTHGTGADFGGIATRITGATLVTGGGEILTIDATTNAELLPAVAVGLGALGVLVDLTIECVPSFAMNLVERSEPLEQVLSQWQERIDDTDHFEFYWFAHTKVAATKTSTRLPGGSALAPLHPFKRWVDDSLVSNTLYGATTAFQRAFPNTTPAINRFSAKLWGNREFTDHSHNTFATERRVRFREMEYAIPQDRVPEALREIDAMIERSGWTVSFPIEVRAAAADDLWMSTASGRKTGYIAVHRHYRENPTEYFAAVEEIMKAHEGRPHWGKMNTRTAADLAPVYPHFGDFLKVRDRLDPDRVFANPYLERVLGA
jgi:FAD-linked oxidoreductase